MNNVDEAEIQRRNRYWAEHWDEFSCFVVVQSPHNANAHVGGFLGGGGAGLFGSIPVPVHTKEIDRGLFFFRDDHIWINGRYRTYCWPITGVNLVYAQDGSGAEIRVPGQPVITVLGPVVAPLIGALYAHGIALS